MYTLFPKELESTVDEVLALGGVEWNLDMGIEECAELIQAINKFKRALKTNKHGSPQWHVAADLMSEEIADVINMCYFLARIVEPVVGPANIQTWHKFKINRMRERYNLPPLDTDTPEKQDGTEQQQQTGDS